MSENTSRRTIGKALSDLYNSRGWLIAFVIGAIGAVMILLAPSPEMTFRIIDGMPRVTTSGGLLTELRIADLGSALVQVAIVMGVFNLILDQLAEDKYIHRLENTLRDIQPDFQGAVVNALAVADQVNNVPLSDNELESVLRNVVDLRAQRPGLGSVVLSHLRTSVFENDEYWRNLSADVWIEEVAAFEDVNLEQDYYRVRFVFSYYTSNVGRSRFSFRVARWIDEYDQVLRSSDFGAVWRLPSSGEFDGEELWPRAFELERLSVNGSETEIVRNDSSREYVAQLPVADVEAREEMRVSYTFTALVSADANLLSFEVPKPTMCADYTININVSDLNSARVLDYFGTARAASISYLPNMKMTRSIQVSIDDWILPKAGLVLIWDRSVAEVDIVKASER